MHSRYLKKKTHLEAKQNATLTIISTYPTRLISRPALMGDFPNQIHSRTSSLRTLQSALVARILRLELVLGNTLAHSSSAANTTTDHLKQIVNVIGARPLHHNRVSKRVLQKQ